MIEIEIEETKQKIQGSVKESIKQEFDRYVNYIASENDVEIDDSIVLAGMIKKITQSDKKFKAWKKAQEQKAQEQTRQDDAVTDSGFEQNF